MKALKIPTHDNDDEFSEVFVDIDPDNIPSPSVDVYFKVAQQEYGYRHVELTPGGAVLLAEQLLKAARKAS